MKQLQKNYTTPEQSKKLLELGMPIESADIAMLDTPDDPFDPFIIAGDMTIWRDLNKGYGIPSWSVGRLIEIWQICVGKRITISNAHDTIDYIFEKVVKAIEGGYFHLSWLLE